MSSEIEGYPEVIIHQMHFPTCWQKVSHALRLLGSISSRFVSPPSLPHTTDAVFFFFLQFVYFYFANGRSWEEDKQPDSQNSWKSSLLDYRQNRGFLFRINTSNTHFSLVTIIPPGRGESHIKRTGVLIVPFRDYKSGFGTS